MTITEFKPYDEDDKDIYQYDVKFHDYTLRFNHNKMSITKKALINKIKWKLNDDKFFIRQFKQEHACLRAALERRVPLYTASIFQNEDGTLKIEHTLTYGRNIFAPDCQNIRWLIIDSYKNFWLSV